MLFTLSNALFLAQFDVSELPRIYMLSAIILLLANFIYAVAENKPAEPGLEQGIYIQKLIGAARRSARTSAWVELDAP